MTTELKSMFGNNIPEQNNQNDSNIEKQNKEFEEKKRKDYIKKQTGMKRELIKLIGGVPSLIEKENNNLNKNFRQKWVWSKFNNPARKDTLKLFHWQRKEDVNKDYEFAQCNKKIDIIDFSKEEYDELIKPNDIDWTYEETLYLWDLLKLYDLRFTIVQDKYDEKKYKDRTIEALKDRYYSICRKILENRKMFDHPILKSGYNYEQELKRRNYLERTMNITVEEINDDTVMLKQAEVIEKKLEQFENIENNIKEMSHNDLINNNENKSMQLDDNFSNNNNNLLIPPKNDIMTFEDYLRNNAKETDSFVYLRSQKMKHNLPVSEKFQKKVEETLNELNIPEKLIPTVRVELAYDKLRNNIVLYTCLKKYLEKKENELNFVSAKLKELQSKKNNKNEGKNNSINNNLNGNNLIANQNDGTNNFDGMNKVKEKKKLKVGTPVKARKRKSDGDETIENTATKKRKKNKQNQNPINN